MLNKITSTSFLVAVLLLAIASAMTHGHWLLLALGAILAAILVGLRIAEGLAPDRRLSIWAGPLWAMPLAPQLPAPTRREAA
jgi:hypothetical protein